MLTLFKKNESGFTLVEVLVVVGIIGVIAAIGVPNLLESTQRAKQRRSMADMKSIANAIGQYLQDTAIVPQVSGRIIRRGTFSAALVPTYIADVPDRDGWGNSFVYRTTARDSYTLTSYGRDGFNSSNATRNDKDWGHDLVIINGLFTASPESGN
jgi:general secretion pathway protein G